MYVRRLKVKNIYNTATVEPFKLQRSRTNAYTNERKCLQPLRKSHTTNNLSPYDVVTMLKRFALFY